MNNPQLKKIFFYLAVAGWVLSLTVHLLSVVDIDAREQLPFIWLLHVGIFVVWIPSILELRKNKELAKAKETKLSSNEIQKILFKNIPRPVKLIGLIGFVYAIINFALFAFNQSGTPVIKNGEYSLESHGQFIKNITEQEYHHYKAMGIRGFSGHWIAFYGLAALFLYPFKKEAEVTDPL